MKYHLSNKPGLEQIRSRIKCYHFSVIPLPHHGSTWPLTLTPKLHTLHLLHFIVQTRVTRTTWLSRRLGTTVFVLGRHVLSQIFCYYEEERMLEDNLVTLLYNLGLLSFLLFFSSLFLGHRILTSS